MLILSQYGIMSSLICNQEMSYCLQYHSHPIQAKHACFFYVVSIILAIFQGVAEPLVTQNAAIPFLKIVLDCLLCLYHAIVTAYVCSLVTAVSMLIIHAMVSTLYECLLYVPVYMYFLHSTYI